MASQAKAVVRLPVGRTGQPEIGVNLCPGLYNREALDKNLMYCTKRCLGMAEEEIDPEGKPKMGVVIRTDSGKLPYGLVHWSRIKKRALSAVFADKRSYTLVV